MRIAYLAAGAAGMYCGSCLHDNTLAAELLDMGEDVVLAPIYTPTRTDEVNVSQRKVFYGGINVYLQQKWSVFRHTPRWFDRWLDSPALLRSLAGRAGSVDPTQLGDLTVSMLRGELGNQRKELLKLVDWLIADVQPDVVHLSNSMMLGLARLIAERCGPPVVCSLSGEDIFLEKLTPPYYEQARALLRERAADAEAFVALNCYYADYMSDYLSVSRERIHVIPHGLRLDGYVPPADRLQEDVQRVGFLARICPEKGLHLLIEAGELLATRTDCPPFTVVAAGYLGAGDRSYLETVQERVKSGPIKGNFHYLGELDRREKIAFLQTLQVFATPTVYRESKGIPALEAMANGVPVVLPSHGAFPELIADTQGGILHDPGSAVDLADKLFKLLTDHSALKRYGESGLAAVHERYHARAMAERTLGLYRQLVPH